MAGDGQTADVRPLYLLLAGTIANLHIPVQMLPLTHGRRPPEEGVAGSIANLHVSGPCICSLYFKNMVLMLSLIHI